MASYPDSIDPTTPTTMSTTGSSNNKRPLEEADDFTPPPPTPDYSGPSDSKRIRTEATTTTTTTTAAELAPAPSSAPAPAMESRVVFVRGIPSDCLESELLALCCPFAVVEKSFLIPTKGQAYVQLPDIPSATNLINFYQTRDANIRGKKISFEFSSHQEITPVPSDSTPTTLPPPSVSSSSIPAASLPSTASTKPLSSHDQSILGHGHGHGHPPGGQGGGPPPVNAILMVSVSKIEYDMTVDVLYQVFQKFGNVQKIITFWKNEEFKALIQMETMDQAQAVQSALNGRDIYTGCNTLHICFSRHTELKVKFNNERSWDYMNPNLPAGPPMASGQQQYGGEEDDYGILPPTPPSYQPQPLPSRTSGYRGMEDQQTGGRYGDGGGSNRYEDIGGSGGGSGGGPRRGASGRDDYRDQRDRGGGRSSHAQRRRSPVIICSNLDQRIIGKPERLFTFFGCFGDVIRVKVMFRKQDTALIQFVDEDHATSALENLDNLVLFGKRLRIDYSKHLNVSMPRGDADQFELEHTRDYSNTPLHRYRRRSLREAVAPCPLLHICGIPPDVQRNQNILTDMFATHGFIKNFHFIQKNSRMAIIEMGTLEEAIMALLDLDDYGFRDSRIRVSFSKAFFQGSDHPQGQGPSMATTGGSGGGNRGGNRGGGPNRYDRNGPRDRNQDRGYGGTQDRGFGGTQDRGIGGIQERGYGGGGSGGRNANFPMGGDAGDNMSGGGGGGGGGGGYARDRDYRSGPPGGPSRDRPRGGLPQTSDRRPPSRY